MKKAPIVLLLLAVVGLASGMFYFVSERQYVLRFSASEIQERLNTKLPQTRTYLHLFAVTLNHAKVALTNGSGRVNAALDALLTVRVGGAGKPRDGALDISAGIRYVAAEGAFYMTDPVIERIAVQGLAVADATTAKSFLTKALAEYCGDHPIYVLKAGNIKQAAARLVLKNVAVENRELVVTLGL